MNTYEIQHFSQDQYSEYISFIHGFREKEDDMTHLRRKWWIFENPNGGYFTAIYNNKQICSTCYVSGKILSLDGQPLKAFEIGETWTASEHRRKGLFAKLVTLCTDLAFQSGGRLVYGTPNSQSAPGYKKLGYLFENRSSSFLNLIPATLNILLHKSKLVSKGIHDRKISNAKDTKELTFKEYFQLSRTFPRCNDSSNEYLKWRLFFSPLQYRFFQIYVLKNQFLFAIRSGNLANYNILLVSEYYSVEKLDQKKLYSAIRKIVTRYYRGHDGIYLLNTASTSKGHVHSFLKNGFVTHRHLPICYTCYPGQNNFTNISSLFSNFQLSDCDIG